MAYINIGRGVLAQANGQWDDALTYFQTALDQARASYTLGAEGRAAGHLADVYLHEGNASYAAHLLQDALPKLNTSGDMEMSSYFVGLLGLAMIQNGKVTEGQQLLGRALRLAEHMEYREYEILWRGALAIEAMNESLFEEARRHLLLVLANVSVGVHYPDHLLTLCRISKASDRLGDSTAALDYARQAVDLLHEDTERRVFLLAQAALGIALCATGDLQNAIEHLQNADDGYDALKLTAAEYSYAELLRTLGAAQTGVGQYDDAKTIYDRALHYAEQNNLPLDLAGIQRDIGIFHTHNADYQQAIQSWMTALRIYEAEGHHARVARIYCDIANLRRQIRQSKRAMKDYEQALMLLNSFDDLETRGIVLSNAATAYVDYGDVTTAEAFFVESIQIAQKNRDRYTEATRRGNYGWFLLNTGRTKSALDMLDYAVRQSQNLNMMLQAAVQTDNIGLVWDELHDYDKAIAYHGSAWQMLEQSDDEYWRAVVSVNLGHSLISKGNLADAETSINAALQAGRQLDRLDVIVRALNGQTRLKLTNGANADLMTNAQEAVQLADAHGGRRLLADSLVLRSEVHARLNDAANAQADWKAAADILRILRLNPDNYQPTWMKK